MHTDVLIALCSLPRAFYLRAVTFLIVFRSLRSCGLLSCVRYRFVRARAVELRNRSWFHSPVLLASLDRWLARDVGNAVLVAADELRHETFQKDRKQTG